MKALKIDPRELRFMTKGTQPKLRAGDVIDDLTVIDYCGKEFIPGRNNWEPVYKVKCSCGEVELRRQRYLLYSRNKTGRSCYKCAQQTCNANMKYLRSSANSEGKTNIDLDKINIDKRKANRVLDEIWNIKLWETRIKYLNTTGRS